MEQAWSCVEALHAVTYFTPEAREGWRDAGLQGFWRGYVAGRAAPLGRVGPSVAGASFAGFSPEMLGRSLPAVWDVLAPQDALVVRRRAAASALRRLLGATSDLGPAAELLADAARDTAITGRALGAANAGLTLPEDQVERLWQLATTLRELRGDGHVAACLVHGLGVPDRDVLAEAAGVVPPGQRENRGWSGQQWHQARTRLREGGLLDEAASVTPAGLSLRAQVEAATDRLAPALPFGTVEVLAPLAGRVVRQGGVSYPNATGATKPPS